MRFGPPVSFARRPDGRHLAYQVAGDGELDLVFLLGFPTNLALLWDNPAVGGFLTKLTSFSRLIRAGNSAVPVAEGLQRRTRDQRITVYGYLG